MDCPQLNTKQAVNSSEEFMANIEDNVMVELARAELLKVEMRRKQLVDFISIHTKSAPVAVEELQDENHVHPNAVKVRRVIRHHVKDNYSTEKTLLYIKTNNIDSVNYKELAEEFHVTHGCAEQRLRKLASLEVGKYEAGNLVLTAKDRKKIDTVLKNLPRIDQVIKNA